jgi:hypothetical protein
VPDWVGAVGSTVAIAVTGYILTNRLVQRDKRREVRVDYLLSAFRRLDASGTAKSTYTPSTHGSLRPRWQTSF